MKKKETGEPRAATVLLVEDEDGVRRLARRALERAGYRVLEASNGAHALELTADFEGPIHLMLTDVRMPGMSGRELADRISHLRPGIAILFMSGYPDDQVVRHGITGPGYDFLEKPFSPHDLTDRVRQLLGGVP